MLYSLVLMFSCDSSSPSTLSGGCFYTQYVIFSIDLGHHTTTFLTSQHLGRPERLGHGNTINRIPRPGSRALRTGPLPLASLNARLNRDRQGPAIRVTTADFPQTWPTQSLDSSCRNCTLTWAQKRSYASYSPQGWHLWSPREVYYHVASFLICVVHSAWLQPCAPDP